MGYSNFYRKVAQQTSIFVYDRYMGKLSPKDRAKKNRIKKQIRYDEKLVLKNGAGVMGEEMEGRRVSGLLEELRGSLKKITS